MNSNRLKINSLITNIVLLSTLILPAPLFAADAIQSHESIQEAARSYASANVSGYSVPPTVTVSRLDSRLRLPKCNLPLEAFSPPAGRKLGKTTVGVRCTGDKPWSLYISVMVSLYSDVVIATHSLSRGAVLTAADLTLEKKDIARLRGRYFSDPARAVGKALKRNLQRGRTLDPQHIITPDTIKKGSKVIILAHSDKIQVRMPGKALSSGAKGTLIRVQNIKSKKELEAIVMSPGVVKVAM